MGMEVEPQVSGGPTQMVHELTAQVNITKPHLL